MDRSIDRRVWSVGYALTIVISLMLLFFLSFSMGCGATDWKIKGESNPTMITLTYADNGKSVPMQVNGLLVLSLEENPTTGFLWGVDGSEDSLVKLQASDYIPASRLGVGGGGQRVLTFKAQRRGSGWLKLKLWREWEGDKSIIQRFTVKLYIQE